MTVWRRLRQDSTGESELPWLVFGIVLTFASLAGAGTIRVEPGASIQDVLDLATDGDTVLVARGVFRVEGPIDFNRLHDAGDPESPAVKNVVLRSEAGPEATTGEEEGS